MTSALYPPILRAAACIAAFASSAVHAGYFWAMRALPIYPSGGGITFTLNMKGWIAISVALTLGALGVAFLVTSCIARPRKGGRWMNAATIVLLIPAGFTFFYSLSLLLGLM
jgi:hypothetical protein